MVDRTERFAGLLQASTQHGATGRSQARGRETSAAFAQATARLVEDVKLLGEEVRHFRMEQAKASLSSVSRTGAIISATAERLKTRFDELEQTIKIVAKSVAESRMPSAQEKQHWEKVCVLLEQRLSALTKEFMSTLEKRTKSLADRSERQKNLFGEGVNYQYKYPPPKTPTPPVPERPASAPNTGPVGNRPGGGLRPPPLHPYPAPQTAFPASTSGAVRHRGPLLSFDQPTQASYESDQREGEHREQQQLVRKRDRLDVMKARLNDVQRVEKTIGELGQMFVRVAGIVKEHEETINDIEALVDDTQANTSQAQMELLKLFKFVSSDRGLIIKLLIATLIFGMIVIYFWT